MSSAGQQAASGSAPVTTRLKGSKQMPMAGWIDVPVCEALLTKDIKVLTSVDGSPNSMVALKYITDGLLQQDRRAFVRVLHVYDESKKYLPPECTRDRLKLAVESLLTSSVSSKRYQLAWVRKHAPGSTGQQINEAIDSLPADFACMGFFGLKGTKRDITMLGATLRTNVADVLNRGNSCSLICIKDEDPELLPIRTKKAVFVVSVSLNKSSTKAFLDALRLSKPGDEIHVVYVKSYLEREDSDYTAEVRLKYEGFFASFRDDGQQTFSNFHDRLVKFELVSKERRESVPQAVVRYADEVEADFLVVGASVKDRVARGKKPVGSVSLQICLMTERNFIVANWIDVAPQVYDNHVGRSTSMRRVW